jgi:hypothetical protein
MLCNQRHSPVRSSLLAPGRRRQIP